MSAREFQGWVRFYALDPWGDQRADLRMGILASTLANLHAKRGARYIRPQDFMPFQELVRQSTAEVRAKMQAFARQFQKIQSQQGKGNG